MAKAGKSALGLIAAAIAGGGAVLTVPAAAAPPPTTVLELFTSQGCSECPPADAVFAQYAARPDVLALTFNVDYWDYLGWKDTLASADNSDRQRQYAESRGDGQVYTPQVIIDGHSHVVGSDAKQIDKAISSSSGDLTVPISMSSSDDSITVTVADSPRPDIPHATLWLVMYDPTVSVQVQHGENGGRTLTYSNVVRKLRPVAMWHGAELSVDIPRSEMTRAKASREAVFLQTEDESGLPSQVIGAATIELGPALPPTVAAIPTTPVR